MAGSTVVRELITVWGFEIDKVPLRELDAGINTIKASLKGLALSLASTAASVGFLLNEAAKEEQTKIAFTTMLGSADAAFAKLKELKDFAIRTPFTVPGIQKNAKQLLAMGIEVTNLLPTLKFLGDVSAGLSVPLERLALNFGQVKAQGKLTGRELRDFAIAGVPLLAALAQQLGKSQAAIQKMVSRGKIGFKEVEAAFIAMTTGSGRFADLMDKQSKSFFGILSNIKDFILVLSIELGEELLPTAKEIVKAFLDFVTVNRKLIKQNLTVFVKNLSVFMKDLLGIVNSLFKSVDGVVKVFGGWNKVLGITFNAITAILSLGLVAGLGTITSALFKLTLGWRAMGNAALFAQAKMALIPITIGAIVVAMALIAEDIIAFSQGRDSVFGRMVKAMDEIFKTIDGKFGGFGKTIKQTIIKMLLPIRLLVAGFKAIGTTIDALGGKIKPLEALKKIRDSFVGTPSTGGEVETFSQAIGVKSPTKKDATQEKASPISFFSSIFDPVSSLLQAIETANDVRRSVTPIEGLGAQPFKTGKETRNISIQAKNEINLNVIGMEPETAKELVTETLGDQLALMMRETLRDGESDVER